MNSKLTLLAVIEILSAMSMGIFILAATYQFLKYYGKKKHDIQPNNQAYGIFMAAVLFSVGLTMSSVIQPLLSLFRIIASKDLGTMELALKFIGYGAIYIALAYLLAVVICVSGNFIY